MRKTIILFTLLSFTYLAYSQPLVQWIIQPGYDSIYFATGADLIVTDSLKYRIFWSLEGKRLFESTETIYPFHEGLAVTANGNQITGFFDTDGHYTDLTTKDLQIARNTPYFHNKNLLVKNNGYHYVDSQGQIDENNYDQAFPFSNGYAVCKTYKNQEAKKGTSRYLIDKNRNIVTLTYKGKNINPENIGFISSVNDEKNGVVVVKKDIFLFSNDDTELQPLTLEDNGRASQAQQEGSLEKTIDSTRFFICGKFNNTDTVWVYFDLNLVPIEFIYNNKENQRIKAHANAFKPMDSDLKVCEKDGLAGLEIDGEIIIPPQFESISCCFYNKAFVKTNNNKHGLLKVEQGIPWTFSLHNGEKIGFRHAKKKDVEICLDMPSYVNPDNVKIKTDQKSGCTINLFSKKTFRGDEKNRVTYECDLNIPENLTENDSTVTVTYPVQIYYDDIKLQPTTISAVEWYVKYININIENSNTEIEKNDYTKTYNYTIDFGPLQNEKDDYQYIVNILLDSTEITANPITNISGYFNVPVELLREGINYLYVEVKEEGCPPIKKTFELTYTKPAKKTKNKPAVKEEIRIKEKDIDYIYND